MDGGQREGDIQMGRIPPNVLKLRKQKRQGRRAYLSRYNEMYVPRSVGKSGIPEDAKALFDYRERAKGFFDPVFDRLFPAFPSKPSDWSSEGANPKFPEILENIGERNGRRWALELAEQERIINSIADPEVCDSYTVAEGGITRTRLTLVYNMRKTRLYFIEVAARDNGASYLMKSMVYGAEDNALTAYRLKRITWLECLPLASLTLVLPRRV